MAPQRMCNSPRSGLVSVLALLLLCILTTLGVAFAASTNLSLQKSENLRLAGEARLAAESGLEYYAYLLSSTAISDTSTDQAILDSLATELADQLNGSANLQGQSVEYDGSSIVIPAIGFDGGKSFRAEITVAGEKLLQLNVVGQVAASGAAGGALERSISIEVEPAPSGALGYGIFAKGPIVVGQNFNFVGASDPAEASMSSAAEEVAITVGSGHIDGDVVLGDPDATVSIGATVGGQIYRAELPDPQIDGSVFEPFATNIVDAGTDTSSGTFTNIRVKAGTNPVFGNHVTILGVMYIEAPNYVYFTNNVTIIGVLVSEDPGPGASPSEHYIYFKNNLSVLGLDQLPDLPEFATLREMVGSAFLLPGFTLEFKNNFTSVSGTIAAERIIVKNNLDGTVYGSIIALGDGGLTLKNNANITIDRSRYPDLAPGIIPGGPQYLALRPSSYTEN